MNVPIGSYYASTNTAKAACTFPPFPPDCNPIGPLGNLACQLSGSTEPFSQATLESRYPTNKIYIDLVKKDARRLRKARFLTREDEKEIVNRARFSGIPN